MDSTSPVSAYAVDGADFVVRARDEVAAAVGATAHVRPPMNSRPAAAMQFAFVGRAYAS